MKIKQIGETRIDGRFPYLILEAGVNHGGDLQRALEMVDVAADLGVPMIKFQSYKAETLASRHSPAYWDRTEEKTSSQYDLFRKYDRFCGADYIALAERCVERGIEFCSTAFDAFFVDALAPYMKVFKVASADLTNIPLLRQIATKEKPVLLSTGASELFEIQQAVSVLESGGVSEIALFHCVLEYPTQPENANLLSIPALKEVFPDYTVGWSDHVKTAYSGSSVVAAWSLGAEIIEKHFTLDKSQPGNDHYHALDPSDVAALQEHLVYFSKLLGLPEKRCLPCENEARLQARRSLVAGEVILAGEVLRAEMLIPKRPGTGIAPDCLDELVGQVTTRRIEKDEVLEWDMFVAAVATPSLV